MPDKKSVFFPTASLWLFFKCEEALKMYMVPRYTHMVCTVSTNTCASFVVYNSDPYTQQMVVKQAALYFQYEKAGLILLQACGVQCMQSYDIRRANPFIVI